MATVDINVEAEKLKSVDEFPEEDRLRELEALLARINEELRR